MSLGGRLLCRILLIMPVGRFPIFPLVLTLAFGREFRVMVRALETANFSVLIVTSLKVQKSRSCFLRERPLAGDRFGIPKGRS